MAKKTMIVARRTNEHIAKYVAEYLKMKKTDFAVLITGSWGTGKSTFVRQDLIPALFPKKEARDGCWYISLNGIASQKQLDLLLFQQAHPVLGSKYARLTGRIVGGILQSGLHVDLKCATETNVGESPKSTDWSVGSDINLNEAIRPLASIAKGIEPRLVIFDDLERVRMPLKEILGVIGGIVEEGAKVLVVANENELENDKQAEYRKSKEKIIGKSFRFRQDLENLYGVLVGYETYTHSEEILRRAKAQIVKVLLKGCKETSINYRALKHAFRDFDYICFRQFPKVIKDNEAFWDDFAWRFIVFSYEYQLGNITDDFSVYRTLGEEGVDKQCRKVLQDYCFDVSTRDARDICLVSSEMFNLLVTGKPYNDERLFKSIMLCRHFIDQQQPDWARLWYWSMLNDKEARETVVRVLDGVSNQRYRIPGEVVQIFNCLICLANKGVKECQGMDLKVFRNYVECLSKAQMWDLESGEDAFADDDQWRGLMFWNREVDFERIRGMCRLIKEKVDCLKEEIEDKRRLLIIENLSTDTQLFLDYIKQYPVGVSEECRIFKGVSPERFFKSFLDLSNEYKRKVTLVIQSKRFGTNSINSGDRIFYRELRKFVTDYLNRYKGEMLPSVDNVRFFRDELAKMV